MGTQSVIRAAGAVVWRRAPSLDNMQAIELLLIHRPRYDDWSFPKGKPDQGEHLVTTAVREVEEETGLRVRLGVPLPDVYYQAQSGPKVVSYWMARATSDTAFEPNSEVDQIAWVSPSQARKRLSYGHDRELLANFVALCETKAHRSRTLIVVRHAKAESRAEFEGSDLDRPLRASGLERARELTELLRAYGVRRLVSSPAKRCIQTLDPYAHRENVFMHIDERLSEQTSGGRVGRAVTALLELKTPTALCSHRPTMPWVFDALGTPPSDLSPGEAVVVHHRKGKIYTAEHV